MVDCDWKLVLFHRSIFWSPKKKFCVPLLQNDKIIITHTVPFCLSFCPLCRWFTFLASICTSSFLFLHCSFTFLCFLFLISSLSPQMTSAEHRPPPPGPKGLIFKYMHPCAISWIVSNISSITLIISHHIWDRVVAIRILWTRSGNGIGNSSNKSQSKKIFFVVLFSELTDCRAHFILRRLLEYV
jgi:hypothetical protein